MPPLSCGGLYYSLNLFYRRLRGVRFHLGPNARKPVNLKGPTWVAWKNRYEEVVDVANEEGMSVEKTIFDILYTEIATMLDMDTVKRFGKQLPKAIQ